MYRYIAMIWNPHDRGAQDRAAQLRIQVVDSLPDWSCRLEAPGITVFDLCSEQGGLTAYVLPKQSGVIFGRLFSLDASVQSAIDVTGITERAALLFAGTCGRYLVENFWGSYVAILQDPANGKRFVIRDCSGKIPCYATLTDGVEVVFSDVQDLDRVSIGPLSINWEYVAAFLTFSQMQIRASGISQISEVLAGECVEFNMNSRRQFALWNPARISTEGVVYDHAEALSLLRDSVQQCIGSWALVHRSILLNLSGGFDSAVVLGCLSRIPDRPVITCANRYGESPQEDERTYARMAAKKAGVNLIEQPWSPVRREIVKHLSRIPRFVKPTISGVFGALTVQADCDLMRTLNVDAIWTGQGGDHIFLQSYKPFGAADFVRLRGIRAGLLSAVLDSSRLSREPYLTVLRSALRARCRDLGWRPGSVANAKSGFVRKDANPNNLANYVAHPWTLELHTLPIGKQAQIYFLSELVNRHRPLGGRGHLEEHNPLISQPLLTACLRIPTYLLLKGGKARGLARAAFSEHVPQEILNRKDKGSTTSFVIDLIRDNCSSIADLLLDGVLAQEHIIDKRQLEPHLRQSVPMGPDQLFSLLACISAEIWARTWMDKGSRAAA
jgi:asparagine synthase (glutamine-hydrolysing)